MHVDRVCHEAMVPRPPLEEAEATNLAGKIRPTNGIVHQGHDLFCDFRKEAGGWPVVQRI